MVATDMLTVDVTLLTITWEKAHNIEQDANPNGPRSPYFSAHSKIVPCIINPVDECIGLFSLVENTSMDCFLEGTC